MKKKHYGSIDGLKTIAAVGIIMMHMAANNDYAINGFFYNTMIPSFTNFVFLFMVISSFGMCCGYYEKVMNQSSPVSEFYSKRFKKVWPFFAILVLLDVAISPSGIHYIEAFADLTLLFGFLPGAGNITVIGVGWFLGVTFIFYLVFPFFCYLLENRKRAWIVFGISILFNLACAFYFNVGRSNILYSGCYFIVGGLIYLYRSEIEAWGERVKGIQWIMLGAVAASIVIYYVVTSKIKEIGLLCLFVSAVLLLYSIIKNKGGGVLDNRIMRFFSGISMEIYLCHMVIFRALEKLHLNTIAGNGWLQYVVTVILVIAGAIVFAMVMKTVIKKTEDILEKNRRKRGYGEK